MSEDYTTRYEIPTDESGRLVEITDKLISDATDNVAANMSDLWHRNTVSNSAFILHHKTPATSMYFVRRTSWKRILRDFIPRYYYAFLNVIHELKSRRASKQRDKILVCGIGDSLLMNCIEVTNAVRNGWKIMAVDRARPQLLSWGLIPDFTVCVDGQKHVVNYLKDLRKGEKIFVCMQCHPDVLKAVNESEAELSVFDMRAGDGYNNIVSDMVGQKFMSSYGYTLVMHSAIDAALQMGYHTVVTIGTELGWSKKEDVEDIYKFSAKQLPSGWWTIKQFDEAANGFRVIAQVLEMSNHAWKDEKGFKPRNLIDASGGIDKGYPYMPIHEILEKY